MNLLPQKNQKDPQTLYVSYRVIFCHVIILDVLLKLTELGIFRVY